MLYGIIKFVPNQFIGSDIGKFNPSGMLSNPSFLGGTTPQIDAGISGAATGGGFLSGAATFLANPVVGAAGGVLSLLGKGINAWLEHRRQKRQEAENKRRWEAMQKQAKAQFEANYSLARDQFDLSRSQYLQNILNNAQGREDMIEQQNVNRVQGLSNKIMDMLNRNNSMKSNYLSQVAGAFRR